MFLVCSTSCTCAYKSIQNRSENPSENDPKSSENRSKIDQKPIKKSLSLLTSIFWNLGSVFASILGAKIDQKSIGHGLREALEATLASATPPGSLRGFSWGLLGPPGLDFGPKNLPQRSSLPQIFLTKRLSDNGSL